MRRDRNWKLVYYLGEPDGELYDLRADPGEIRNLWGSAEHVAHRDRLVKDMFDWAMRGALRSRMPGARKPQQPMLI